MKVVVLKFGGTSVATPEGRARVTDKIAEACNKGFAPVVVASAMGRRPEPYATDSLLDIVASYGEHHDARELDMLMACGEILSIVLLSHHLRSAGYQAVAMDAYAAGIHCNEAHGEAAILQVHPERLRAVLEEGGLPVVAGFQGVNSRLEISTLGRGGSDTTAVALGAALRAAFVEIYTDVSGVLTADPRVCDEARVLDEVDFEEMGELAMEGAKVVHPRAVDLAEQHGVPVWVKSTFTGDYGTFLTPVPTRRAFEKTRVVTAVAHMTGLSQVNVDLGGTGDLGKGRQSILQAMADRGISLDLINLCGSLVVFIVRTEPFEAAAREALEGLGVPFYVRSQCAKISLVGAGMRGTAGVMNRALRCLNEAGVEVFHTTDSNITISCLIPATRLRDAISAVHKEFEL